MEILSLYFPCALGTLPSRCLRAVRVSRSGPPATAERLRVGLRYRVFRMAPAMNSSSHPQPAAWTALLIALCFAAPVRAQTATDRPVASRTVETTTNLFATVDLAQPADAFRLTLPPGWDAQSVAMLRYGATPVASTMRAIAPGTYRVRADRPIRGPYEVIVRVTTGPQRGTHAWTLTPMHTDEAGQERTQGVEVRRRVVLTRSEEPDPRNRALVFGSSASAPVRLQPSALPPWAASDFTVEGWVRTIGRNEVILSTWSGNERDPYLLDVVVASSGRVRAYFGRSGSHRSLVSTAPIADGNWQHVAVTYASERRTLRLLLNGTVVDSLRGVSLPTIGREAPALTLGGRSPDRPAASGRDSEGVLRFSGALDEVRIWATYRSPVRIRQTMRRSVASVEGQRLVLSFDNVEAGAAPTATGRWPDDVRPRPSTRPRALPLQNLHAVVEERDVHLRWSSAAQGVEAFIVERSEDGRTFQQVARVAPQAVAVSPSNRETRSFAFTDDNASGHVVFYRIRQEGERGSSQRSGTLKVGRGARSQRAQPVELVGNFPNPFSSTTTIAYRVREPVPVTITVWNLTGNQIAELADGVQDTGQHELSFAAGSLPSGTYFVRMESPTGTQSHRMVLLK